MVSEPVGAEDKRATLLCLLGVVIEGKNVTNKLITLQSGHSNKVRQNSGHSKKVIQNGVHSIRSRRKAITV